MNIKHVLIAILTSIALVQCSSPENNIVQHNINYTNSDLEGNWILMKVEIIKEKQSITQYKKGAQPDIPQEWSAPVYLGEDGIISPHFPEEYLSTENGDLNITEDSIFWLNYPLELCEKSSYSIKSDILIIGDGSNENTILLNPAKDTLSISYLDFYGIYLKKTYVKTTFEDDILNILIKYNTNFPLLAGNWELIRVSSGEYGEQYRLDFFFTNDIPDTIALTKHELESTLHTERSYQMMTDGMKRKYFMKYDDDELLLIPDNWYNMDEYHAKAYNEDNLTIRFRRIQE